MTLSPQSDNMDTENQMYDDATMLILLHSNCSKKKVSKNKIKKSRKCIKLVVSFSVLDLSFSEK